MWIKAIWSWIMRFLSRQLSWPGLSLLVLAIAAAPAFLFFDPGIPFLARKGHIERNPLQSYRLFSDDIPYIAASRTWETTRIHLFRPHNTHISPVWRLITWALVRTAGRIESIPAVFATATYCALVTVMLLVGVLVARETGKQLVGLAAMAGVGVTSIMYTAATWYSAGQPLWAGMGIIAALLYAQKYRRSGSRAALGLSAVSAVLGGWCWTIGHMAGPVATLYLLLDPRRKFKLKLGAFAPILSTIAAVALSFALADQPIDSRISFHGRTVAQAFHPLQGLFHTLQAIPENLVLGNLGLTAETTRIQGAVLTLGLLALWLARPGTPRNTPNPGRLPLRLEPLEGASLALVFGAYLVEWTFRGYLDYRFLRTINPRFIVPWYDVIPQIGAALLVASRLSPSRSPTPARPLGVTRFQGLLILLLLVGLVELHRPRIDALIRAGAPPLSRREQALYPDARLQKLRANSILTEESEWQHIYLHKLDLAEAAARRLGASREAIRRAVGHPWVPASVGLLRPELFDRYDAVSLLDIPDKGGEIPIETIRSALGELLVTGTQPRPQWLDPGDPWPPPEPPPESRIHPPQPSD